ncbi:glycosyltransferase family 2 protein [Enterococcus pseudoavium]|uniref:glycosyltransferase family 2 protein n=1 Tax=Enterococcus pseudoavium TaxID=44007 RepID=UPI000830C94E|nr:glycosyltransferase family 2 protein [Enterococcus pseudoavium]REC32393.1 glycosyltransferase family 2 protein [Enterococcus pseudoavium]
MDNLISIIIPVYNVENYLEKCLHTIVDQTYSQLEIIIIDDGSTDKSNYICRKFKDKDSRIILIEQENKGLAIARNVGLNQASGKFVTFLDGDDYVTESYVENLFQAIVKTGAEISISNYVVVDDELNNVESSSTNDEVEIITYNQDEGLKNLFLQKGFETTAWGKLYLMSLFDDIRFPDVKAFEDFPITYKLFMESKKIAHINTCDYMYVKRMSSIMNTNFNESKLILLEIIEDIAEDLYKKKPYLEEYYYTRIFSSLISLWVTIPLDNKSNLLVWNELLKYRKFVIVAKKSAKKLRLLVFCSLCGRTISSKVGNRLLK